MKPLRLTLDAVGPYAGRQVIDFRPALEARIFGIYGPTGAGKSTIFSAMTFALFGQAANSQQHISTLRSDHADPTRLTEVEFIFETHGRLYRIVRRPEQMRPAKRGGGETKEPHKATLFDVTGLDLSTVGDAAPGKVLAESKVEAVNKEIIALLGYGPAQFRQIVLLPQGRFETFLAANTDERKDILRELFDVSLYRRLAEQVKAKADAAESKVKTARDVCTQRLSAEGFAAPAELAAGIEAATADLVHQRNAVVAAKSSFETAAQVYQVAALTDQAFTEHVEAEMAFKAVSAEGEAIAHLGKRIARARSAHLLSHAEDAIEASRKAAGQAARVVDKAAEDLEEAEAKAQAAAQRLAELCGTSSDHERDKARLQDYDAHAQRLAASANQQSAAVHAATKAAADKKRAEISQAAHDARTRAHGEAVRHLDNARTAALRRAALRTRSLETSQALQAATRYERAQSQLAADRGALARLDAAAAAAQARLTTRQAAFDAAEAALLQNHALHVASHLVDGAPCPACGSRDHPAPARGVHGDGALTDTYQREKTAFETARQNADEARTRAAAARDGLARREIELQDLPSPARTAKALEDDLRAITGDLDALGPEIGIDALEAQRAECEADVASALAALQADQAAALASDRAAALAQQSLDDALRSVPQELRNAQALADRQAALKRKIADHAAALEKARADERETNDALIAARSDTVHAANAKVLANERLASAHSAFVQRLADADFSEAAYQQSKADIPLVAELEARVSAHQERLIRTDERLRKAALAIENAARSDIKALKDAKDAAEAAHAAANDLAAGTNARLMHLEKLSGDLAAEIARLDRLEQETGPLRELADAFTGRNDMKMDLETFAIATMFDHVLEAANLRLGPMSRGRYMLVRETEGRGNARRGLGLSIDDAYTGRQRPAATLSGGETFIAALALALGLSDVVESVRGSVRLDTIFIDEGFGSLDAEGDAGTLEQVLETLQDLVGQNRAVGLISHVPLVQQAIPNGFWITKTASGSQIETRT